MAPQDSVSFTHKEQDGSWAAFITLGRKYLEWRYAFLSQLSMSAAGEARPTIRFVDEYCQLFAGLFPEVRSFEAFKLLHLGMISEIKRKSLPAIAKAVGLDNHQALHHFR